MTDGEIDAAAKHAYDLGYRAGALRAAQIALDLECDAEIDAAAKHAYDLGYRAGMLRSAQIALECYANDPTVGAVAAAIERAAADEQKEARRE